MFSKVGVGQDLHFKDFLPLICQWVTYTSELVRQRAAGTSLCDPQTSTPDDRGEQRFFFWLSCRSLQFHVEAEKTLSVLLQLLQLYYYSVINYLASS